MPIRQNHETDTEKLQRRNRELSILNAIAEALNREVDLNKALRAALAQVAELFDLQTAWLFLRDEKTGAFYLAAAQNLPPALGHTPQQMQGTCYCLDTYEGGDLDGAANVNIITCSRLKGLLEGTDGLRYHASIPLYAHGKKLGVLNVVSPDWQELSDDDLQLLYTVGDLVSIAIERARLFMMSAQLGAVEERNRLAREIHDTLAQTLAGITMQLETADALLDVHADAARVQQVVHHALRLSRASLDEVRRSVLDLRAAPLEGRTLAEALEELAASATGTVSAQVVVDRAGANHPLPVRIEVGLYRIAQEAINNAIRHAQAARIEVSLLAMPDRVQLVVEDDGLGFDPDDVPPDRFGLIGLNERARLLGGSLSLETCVGEGTRIEVTIPLGVEP